MGVGEQERLVAVEAVRVALLSGADRCGDGGCLGRGRAPRWHGIVGVSVSGRSVREYWWQGWD